MITISPDLLGGWSVYVGDCRVVTYLSREAAECLALLLVFARRLGDS